MSPSTPRTARPTGGLCGLRVGDSVTLPDGQAAILKYVGKIQGKMGEYAGVELVGEYASQGRHSGTYNGVAYFTTSQPNAGLFITYSKLIGANSITRSPRALRTPSLRASGVTRPVHLPPVAQPDLGGSPMSPSRKQSLLARPRKSIADQSLMASPAKKRATGLSPAKEASPTATRRLGVSSTPQRTGLVTSRKVSMASDIGTAPSVDEFATLTRELREARNAIADKDAQLEHQSQILREMEQSLAELEKIATANGNRPCGGEDTDALLRAIDEKDKKIISLKHEFEEKRKEFRETIDGLQDEIQETSELYEAEIRSLKQNLGQAAEVTTRIVELEQIVASLESGLKSSQTSEQNARVQLSRLADVENRLLDKDQQVKDARMEIDRYKELLEDAARAQNAERRQSGVVSQGIIVSLQRDKDQLEQMVKELQAKITSLESDFDANNNDGNRVGLIRSLQVENEQLKKSLETERASAMQLQTKLQTAQDRNIQLSDHNEVASLKEENGSLHQEIELQASQIKELEQEIAGLESMVETKLFRETELEKELETLKIRSNSSSAATTFTDPTTPRSNETELTDVDELRTASSSDVHVDKSPARVSDPASGRKLWCGLCEREGHESLDCPYEEEF